MLADRTVATMPSLTNRSKTTNGTKMLAGVDGRSAAARRYRDLVRSFVESVGEALLGEADKAQIRTAAALTVEMEGVQAQIVNGEPIDHEQATRLANAQQRALKAIGGIKRRAPPKPSIRERLIARQEAQAREAASA